MATAAIVLSKCRQALAAYITAGNVGTSNIYDAKRSGDKTVENITCNARNAKEDPDCRGNWWVDLEVTVAYPGVVDADGTDPKAASETLTTNTFNLLETDDLPAQLSNALDDFTVMGLGEDSEVDNEVDGDCWKDIWRRRVYCCASDL